ncbi:MAG: PhzF family phenazine biosynthesis protein, partial [Firmicutes bacterium]|nr:PhzF family phenazine biosynthesis protein [Bacillota bacterium]
MSEREFYIVDVFAEEKYAGNQLAVFTQGHLYTDAEMQKLTKEMNYSESTFIFPVESAGNTFRVRIFTPAREVPFAGHPTLGTAYVILKKFVHEPVPEVVLDLKVGRIPVAVSYTPSGEIADLIMKQVEPSFGPTVEAAKAAAVLSLPTEAVDRRYPVQEVSTGLPFLIVPLKSLAHVRAARVNLERLAHLWERLEARGLLVFAPETYTPASQLNVRVFCHYLGVPEDPATGSGNGCLAGYLIRHKY